MIDHWGGVFRQSEDSSQTGVSSSRPSRKTHSIVPKTEIPTSNQTDVFSKRTQLLFRYFSFIPCSLSHSSQCSVQDLTQQEHLHIFAQIFATFLTRSFLAGMFDGQYNIIYNTYCVTQLKLDTVEKLSSPIFCCLSVSQSARHRCHPTKSPLFPIYTRAC